MAEKNSWNSFNEEKVRLRKKSDDKIRLNRLINEQRSNIQYSTIHEGEIYNPTLRRISLSIPNSSSLFSSSSSSTSNTLEYSRKKFQSFYRSFIPSKSSTENSKKSFHLSSKGDRSRIHSSSNEKSFRERTHRYSLPDTSTRTFILKNLRQKTAKRSFQDDSIRSTFQHFLSLVKFSSNKSHSPSSTSQSITISSNFHWTFHNERSEWYSSTGIGRIHLSSIELHNLTSIECEHLQKKICEQFQSSANDLNIPFHFLKGLTKKSPWMTLITEEKRDERIRLIDLDRLRQIQSGRRRDEAIELNKSFPSIQFHCRRESHDDVSLFPLDEPIRKRKHHFMFRSKSTEKSKETKDSKSNGNVFGIALSECVQDEQESRPDEQMKISSKRNEENSFDRIEKCSGEKNRSPSGSVSSINDSGYSLSPTSPSTLHICHCHYEERKYRSVSLEALGLQQFSTGIHRSNTLRCYPAKVPELIQNCCDYLEKYGLQTVGLFRVGVSKKRLKELRDHVNSNRTLTFDSTTNVHDIAGLIKEFLRELPEPLLTRHLSLPFIHIRTKIPIEEQNEVLSNLIRLLPSSNRDTLYRLLKCLHHVSLNSQDRYSSDGKLLSLGNKMDTENLAIVFAPTILMENKIRKDSSISLNTEQIEQGKEILKMMIDHYKDLFLIKKSLHDELCQSVYQFDYEQFIRLLAFKVQNRCGIQTMEFDDDNEEFLRSIDLKCFSTNENFSETSTLISGRSSLLSDDSQSEESPLRRYNLRRNSDFPCSSSSSHSSRSSEYLQVPLSKSQHRLSNSIEQSSKQIKDIREARMDQIIFRLVDPTFSSRKTNDRIEPIINITDENDQSKSPMNVAAIVSTIATTTSTTTSNNDLPLGRELKTYARSKTAPLAFSSSAKQILTPKRCEARDLCGTSSNDSSK